MYARNKRILGLVTLVIVLITYILTSTLEKNDIFYNSKIIGFISLFFAFWGIISWWFLKKEIISFYIFYFLIMIIFTLGHGIIFALGGIKDSDWLLSVVNKETYYDALKYSLFCIQLFHLFSLLSAKNIKKINYDKRKEKYYNLKIVAYFLLLVSAPYFFYEMVKIFLIVRESGYIGIYGYDGSAGINPTTLIAKIGVNLSVFFIPALILLLLNAKDRNKKYIIGILFLITIFDLYVGKRSDAIKNIFLIVLSYHYCIKKITIRQTVFLFIAGYFGVSILSIIQISRDLQNTTFFDVFRTISGKENLFLKTITEMGGSIFPTIKIMELFPLQYDFFYGKSYMYSFLSIIPNFGFWDIHPTTIYAEGPNWLKSALGLNYGPGFSLVAESYRNFGSIGFIVFAFYGMFFGRIFSLVDVKTFKNEPVKVYFLIIFFALTFMSVRGDNLYIIRPIFFILIPLYIVMIVVQEKNFKKLFKF